MADANAQHAEALKMFATGATARDVARKLDRPESTMRRWRTAWKSQPQASQQSDAKDMEIAALKQKLRESVPVQPEWQNETDYAELWRMAEEENARRVDKVLRQ